MLLIAYDHARLCDFLRDITVLSKSRNLSRSLLTNNNIDCGTLTSLSKVALRSLHQEGTQMVFSSFFVEKMESFFFSRFFFPLAKKEASFGWFQMIKPKISRFCYELFSLQRCDAMLEKGQIPVVFWAFFNNAALTLENKDDKIQKET